jgi:transcription antitermination factor NusG
MCKTTLRARSLSKSWRSANQRTSEQQALVRCACVFRHGKSVQRALTERIERAGMQDQFGQILVPTEEVVEVRNGQKSVTERRFFPGYVLVEMEMTDETWHLVKNTRK